jgi:hypothetical protein
MAASLLLLGVNRSCDGGARSETVYGLTADSTLAEGCFPPLRCPVALSESLGGTFRLRLLAAGDSADLYEVRDVYWLARLHGEDVPITGSGTFIDGPVDDQMHLELRIGDDERQAFDSGPVRSDSRGVDQIDITVSINGQSYFDTVIDIHAAAFPPMNRTPCGPAGLVCDSDTEVCVARTPIGPAIVYGCEAVPDGCGDDRSCACAGVALCEGAFGNCTEQGENQLQCECPKCQ